MPLRLANLPVAILTNPIAGLNAAIHAILVLILFILEFVVIGILVAWIYGFLKKRKKK
jgi:hypothetical protein